MTGNMLGIGRMARESGLPISALRFYDTAGVLAPEWTDPFSGYRWYAPSQLVTARLIAGLRRAGLPLADTRAVLEHRHNHTLVDAILDAHLRRLESTLADSRQALFDTRALLHNPLLTPEETMSAPTVIDVTAEELAAGLRQVRYAAGSDLGSPALTGVVLDVDGGVLTVAATDRYRLAAARIGTAAVHGPDVQVIAPTAVVDDAIAVLRDRTGPATLTIDGEVISMQIGERRIEGGRVDHEFPDFRSLLPGDTTPPDGVLVDASALRNELRSAPTSAMRRERDGYDYKVVKLDVDPNGRLVFLPHETSADGTGVSQEFLLDAVEAVDGQQLVVHLDGPVAPLAIYDPNRSGWISILMPTRLPASV